MSGFIPSKGLYIIIIFVCLGVGIVLFNAITQNDDLKNLTVLVKETKTDVAGIKNEIEALKQTEISKEDIQRLGQKVDSLNLPSNITTNIFNYIFNIYFVLSVAITLFSFEILKFVAFSLDAKIKRRGWGIQI